MHHVWMNGTEIGRVSESRWGTSSAALLRSWSVPYRYPPITAAVIALTKHFGVRVDAGDDSNGAVLGKGARGTVLRVRRVTDGRVLALKVVLTHTTELMAEVPYMKRAHDRVAEAVVAIEGDGFTDGLPCGICYGGDLVSEVGGPVRRLSLRLMKVFQTLQRLHAASIVHGDARIQNIILLPGSRLLKFVDFRCSACEAVCTERALHGDVRSLVMSIFQHKNVAFTAEEVDSIASQYSATVEDARKVAIAVERKWVASTLHSSLLGADVSRCSMAAAVYTGEERSV